MELDSSNESSTARARNHRSWMLRAPRALTNALYKTEILWRTLRTRNRLGPGRTGAGDPAEVVPPDLEEDVGEHVRVVGPDRAGVSVEPT